MVVSSFAVSFVLALSVLLALFDEDYVILYPSALCVALPHLPDILYMMSVSFFT